MPNYFEKAKMSVVSQRRNTVVLCTNSYMHKERQYGLLYAISSCLNPLRLREVWMHPHYFASLDMVQTSFPDELWYSNFSVTLGYFPPTTGRLTCLWHRCSRCKFCHDSSTPFCLSRKVQDFGASKAHFRPQSLRFRGQS